MAIVLGSIDVGTIVLRRPDGTEVELGSITAPVSVRLAGPDVDVPVLPPLATAEAEEDGAPQDGGVTDPAEISGPVIPKALAVGVRVRIGAPGDRWHDQIGEVAAVGSATDGRPWAVRLRLGDAIARWYSADELEVLE